MVLAGISCDTLDVNDPNKGEEDTFFVNRKSAEMAVSGAYVLARRATLERSSWAMYSDVRSGMLKINGSEYEDFHEQSLNSPQALFADLRDWGRFYDAITQCNVVIEKVPEIHEFITSEEQAQFVAEAKFLRALLYFNMVRIWGDVPLITKTDQIDAMSRTPQTDVLEAIINDLNVAMDDLPAIYLTVDGEDDQFTSRVRATKSAANLLLAHIYTMLGNYPLVLSAVNEIVDTEYYELRDGGFIQNVFSGITEETIFSFVAVQSTNDDFELSRVDRDVFNDDIYYNGKVSPRVEAMPYAAINALYSGADIRRSKYFSIDDVAESVELRKITSTTIVNAGFLRYADVLMLGAEATMESDPVASEAFLNQVRNRSGLANYDIALDGPLKDAILTERRREFYAEGHDFYDLARFAKLSANVANISPADVRDGIAQWPLSSGAFDNNAMMTQNSFWNK